MLRISYGSNQIHHKYNIIFEGRGKELQATKCTKLFQSINLKNIKAPYHFPKVLAEKFISLDNQVG